MNTTFYPDPVVIDPLGAPTPEQIEEVKASPAMKRLNNFLIGVTLVVVALIIWAIGVWMGATDPLLWNFVPGVEEPPTVYVEAPAEEE